MLATVLVTTHRRSCDGYCRRRHCREKEDLSDFTCMIESWAFSTATNRDFIMDM
jgi:hypothetical protein